MIVECQMCGNVFADEDMVAATSADNPGCPSCGSDDVMDVRKVDNRTLHEAKEDKGCEKYHENR